MMFKAIKHIAQLNHLNIHDAVGCLTQLGVIRAQLCTYSYSAVAAALHAQVPPCRTRNDYAVSVEDQHNNQGSSHFLEKNAGGENKKQIGWNVSRKDKLVDLSDNKEVIYGTLDGWVAWEQDFPIGKLRMTLIALEKEQQWHRVIQVIKWILSKGQGTTMGTFGQLIHALDMDQRPEEAHKFWQKKIGMDLHTVPWQLCKSMMSIYYRNNMLENLVKLFEGLEAFDRKPPQKSIVRKVADAYEILGRLEKKERVLEKYNYLFNEDPPRKRPKKTSD